MLAAREVTERFPALRCPADWVGLFEPGAGYLRAEACVSALARLALRQGATLCGETRVVAWHATDDEVVVQTERERFRAARLILCGGAWSTSLVGERHFPLRVTRQVVHWVWPQFEMPFQSPRLPCWAIDPQPPGDYAGIYYGFPLSLDPPGVKLGWHAPGQEVAPDRVPREVKAEERDWMSEFSRRFMPQLLGQVLGTGTCLYTYSSDGHFIVDRHPQHPNVCLAAGFSGHGFKFAPVIGQALADLCLDGQSPLPMDFLSLSRWQRASAEPRLSG
jgi:glycine/D-amino acid oxidase-like deaminating enzyme